MNAGGSSKQTVVGYGLTGALFVFGWVVLGIMLLMNEIFGGVELTSPREPDGAGS
jgi:hypothetical protein